VPRSLPRALALALLLVLAVAAVASAASVRTATTPAQLRAGKAAYERSIAAGYVRATKLLDAQLAQHPRKPAVVLDIDETTMSNWACLDAVGFELSGLADCMLGSRSVAYPAAKAFIAHARARKVAIVFITGAPAGLCSARRRNLLAQGIRTPFKLTCRPQADRHDTVVPFKSSARRALVRKGATILVNIGDQKSDLTGGGARKTVLLPNPIYVSA
jgi:predicted secreted acid phosphatase